MKSLRVRLLVVVLSTLVVFWVFWIGCQVVQMGRHQTGQWDMMLRNIGTQIILSLPVDTERVMLNRRERFQVAEQTGYEGDKVSFQAWVGRHHLAMQSPGAPDTPLKADFADGFAEVTIGGQPWRVFAVSDVTGRVQVQVGKPKALLRADIERWTALSLSSAVLVLLLLKASIWGVVHWSFRPVTAARRALGKRSPSDLNPLPTGGLPSEVRPLVESFNALLAQLDTAMQTEKRFIADAAHELRTPLAALLAHTQLAASAENPECAKQALVKLAAGVERSARLSEQLLDLARIDASKPQQGGPLPLYETVELVVRDFEMVAAQKQHRIVLDLEPCDVQGHVDAVGVLVRNLIDNALRYTPAGGRCVVSCRSVIEGGREVARLKVADNGPGVPPHERERIFNRFYRVPGAGGRGSGIGLSLVARIAQLHQARIGVGDGLDGAGFAIWVDFELAGAPPAQPPRRHPEPSLPSGQRPALST
ncbi:ATP-binding protein [Caldimonas brevitalea]|uniref:histidine kinase n=1 Tax=Caldimonas brevitalea TaxID=413882 RepID=A0A0G3BNC8_9BURK|nr:ATP-binding protein [Caldimonas brevitalea]AKJ28055.1 two component system histidine kinase [Caldimonas brevitalea]